MGADADLQFVAHGVADGLEDLRGVFDGLQREVPGQWEVRHEGIDLAGRVALLDELLGDRTGFRGIFPDAGGGHVRVGAELLVAATAQEVVDRLARSLADDVPEGHFDGGECGRAVKAGVSVVVVGGVHALPGVLDLERAVADDEPVD